MALPRYQQVGVEYGGGVKGIDFPSRGEMVAGYNALSNTLDQMSQSFFKEAATAAKEEGEKYGAENAPTQEQLKDAIASGTPLPKVGDSRTYFGRAASSAYSDIVTTQVQYAAKTDIHKIKYDAEAGVISVNAIVPKINSVIRGYKGALADVDPSLARKLEAQLAYEGNNAFLAASKSAAAKAANELKTQNALTGLDLVNSVVDDFKAGDTVSADGTKISIEDRINIRAEEIRKISAKLPAAAAKQLEEKFNKEIATQQKNFVLDWIVSGADVDERETRRRAVEDSFGKKKIDPALDPNGTYYNVIKSMEAKEVRDTVKTANEFLAIRRSDDYRIFKKQDDALFQSHSNTYEEFVYKIEAARRAQGDRPTFEDIQKSGLPITGNKGINQTALLRQINSLEFGEGKRNADVYNDLYSRAILPPSDPRALKTEEVNQAAAAGKIRYSDVTHLYDTMRNAKSPEGRAEESAKSTFLRAARNTLTRVDATTGLRLGDDAYLAFEQEFNAEYIARKEKGDSYKILLDPKNSESLWGLVASHQKTPAELINDLSNRLRSQSKPVQPPPAIVVPDESKKPGETTIEYLRRTGGR